MMTAFSAKRVSVVSGPSVPPVTVREAPAIAQSPVAGAASLGDGPDAVTSKQKSPGAGSIGLVYAAFRSLLARQRSYWTCRPSQNSAEPPNTRSRRSAIGAVIAVLPSSRS